MLKRQWRQFGAIIILGVVAMPPAVLALENRAQTVNEELDCVLNAFSKQEKVSWSDVCYTNEKTGDYHQKVRMASVDEELNDVESDYDYSRESEYQSSLDYLENFIATTEGRKVAAEEPWYQRSKSKAADRVAEMPAYESAKSASYAYDYSVFENESGLEADKFVKTKFDVGM